MGSESREDQAAAEGSQPTAEGSQPTAAKLQAYVAANQGKFTDAVMTAELTQAGYAVEDIRAALAAAVPRVTPPPTGRAVRTILVAYGVTFALLSLGMFANTGRNMGSYVPDSTAGIAILGVSLAAALVASLIWVTSRRVFALAVALFLGLSGIGSIVGGAIAGFGFVLAAIFVAWLALRTSSPPSERTTATLNMLIVVPMLFLLAVGGICVASGLPIPRVG